MGSMNDYAALIEKARARTQNMTKPNVVDDLADALEAFAAENEIVTVLEEKWRSQALAAMDERDALRAQLDEGLAFTREQARRGARKRRELERKVFDMRAQLDGMTEQFGWAHKYGGLIIPFTHDAPRPEDQYNTKVRRLVGPWVEVE